VRRIAVTVTLLGVLLLSLAAGAGAQVYDDGPADKEYAIPLKEARDKGKTGNTGQGDQPTSDRFGAGISADPEVDQEAEPTGAPTGPGKAQKSSGAKKQEKPEEEAVEAVPSSSGDRDGGGGGAGADNSAALLTGGIALAVLLIGGAVALMARRTATDDV
jgi:hypothetical protein